MKYWMSHILNDPFDLLKQPWLWGKGDMGESNSRLILCVYNHTVVCTVIYHQFRHESRFGKDILTMIVWKMKNKEKDSFDIDVI